MQITSLPTPQVLIDRRRLERNLDRVQAMANAHNLRLRPHAKTHKSPAVGAMQVERGAVGLCCAKIGEAEVFIDAGIADIRLPYPVHPSNAARLLALMDRAKVSIIVDNLDVARGWSEVMHRAGRTLDVLVKVDVGFHRCGIDPVLPGALEFVTQVAGLPGLAFRGLLSHAGNSYAATTESELASVARTEAAIHRELAAAARGAGIRTDEISVGATPSIRFSVAEDGITEVRPGNYAYLDRTQVALGSAALDDCAMTVMATVVTKPAPDRIILDSGSKTLTNDQARGFGDCPGFGLVLRDLEAPIADSNLLVQRLSEEHATVKVLDGHTDLKPGDRVRVVPNHACVVSNLMDAVLLVDGLTVVDTLPISARGKIT